MVKRKTKFRRTSTLDLHHFVEFKGREVSVTFNMIYYRGYSATKHSPEEPSYWDVVGFQVEDGFDHLEKFVFDKLEDSHFMDELCDLANQQAEGQLERWKHGDI